MYADIHDLARDRAYDIVTGAMRAVDMTDLLLFIVGFCCTTASDLNWDKDLASSCLWNIGTATGNTFFAVLTVPYQIKAFRGHVKHSA